MDDRKYPYLIMMDGTCSMPWKVNNILYKVPPRRPFAERRALSYSNLTPGFNRAWKCCSPEVWHYTDGITNSNSKRLQHLPRFSVKRTKEADSCVLKCPFDHIFNRFVYQIPKSSPFPTFPKPCTLQAIPVSRVFKTSIAGNSAASEIKSFSQKTLSTLTCSLQVLKYV